MTLSASCCQILPLQLAWGIPHGQRLCAWLISTLPLPTHNTRSSVNVGGAIIKLGSTMMGPHAKWVNMQKDSSSSDSTPQNSHLHQPHGGGNRREPASLGVLNAGLSSATLCVSSHFGGVENTHPSFQLCVGTLAKYPQNIGSGKSSYKTEWAIFQNRKLPDH